MLGLRKLIQKLKRKSLNTYQSGWNMPTESEPVVMNPAITYDTAVPTPEYKSLKEDTRIEKKPVEVVGEIIAEEPVMNMKDLDIQIKIVKRRLKALTDLDIKNNSNERLALYFLKARKKYIKRKNLFKWPITTSAKITALCSKYKLRSAFLEGYARNVPTEALDELEKYINAYQTVTEGRPKVELIIDDGGKETRKDPILLASSPFGRWFYVLGAWDKEIEYVDDIIYKNK